MENPKKVLIVEDEKNIVDILRFNLQRAGYATEEAYDGEDGLAKARSGKPDLILLDVMLPKRNGFDVCRALRAEGDNVPVLILTAREEEADKVLGLEIGADDYITKPFSMRELIARVGANIRRTAMQAPAEPASAAIEAGDLRIDPDSRQVFRAGQPIELTQVEFQIMEYFFTNPGKALSRTNILTRVWGEEYFGEEKIVDVNIRRLRMKIEEDPSSPQYILTVWGMGYKWNVQG